MNYDLFISPSAVESAAASAVNAGAGFKRADLPHWGPQAADRPLGKSASDPLSTEEVDRAVSAFNEVFKQANIGVSYQVDKATGDMVIKLIDRDTQKVLRQMPPDEILAMRQRLEELLGVIFDHTA